MNQNIKPATLKIFTLAAALLGYLLRYLLYATAIDQKGLIISGHWVTWGLTGLTLLFLAGMILLTRNPKTGMTYEESFPSSFWRGYGAIMLGSAILIRTFYKMHPTDGLDKLVLLFGALSGVSLLIVGICRFLGRKPHFLFHSALSIYFALRTVGLYRTWSSDPQLMDYVFYLLAFICLMLCAYYQAQFHVNAKSHRPLWITAMAATYLSIVAIPESGTGVFLLGCALWAFTCTPQMNPRPRRQHPAMQANEEP